MKQIIKIAGVCVVALGMAACGGGSDGGNRVGGSDNAGGSGTPAADRTGKANYVGTFSAKASPNLANANIRNTRYTGGNFSGDVKAQADFDSDTIDLELVGHSKKGVMDIYNAKFEDARIAGRNFWGRGAEDIFVNAPYGSVGSKGAPTKATGEFVGGGSRISGTTKTLDKDRLLTVETDFSASEK